MQLLMMLGPRGWDSYDAVTGADGTATWRDVPRGRAFVWAVGHRALSPSELLITRTGAPPFVMELAEVEPLTQIKLQILLPGGQPPRHAVVRLAGRSEILEPPDTFRCIRTRTSRPAI